MQLFAPEEIKQLFDKHFYVSVPGDPSKGEEWDFIFEVITCCAKLLGNVLARCHAIDP